MNVRAGLVEYLNMQLLRLQDAYLTIQDRIFRESALLMFLAGAVFAALAVGIYLWNRFGGLPFFFVVVSGGFLALFSLICFRCFGRTLAPANWLVAVSGDRILIKFRSYLNDDLPADDLQVISVSFSEIEAAQITKQKLKYYRSQREGSTTEYNTCFDLLIRGGSLQPLKERLKYEHTAMVTRDRVICKVSSKAQHYPVSVPDERTIRILWRSPASHVVPGVRQLADLLARQRVTIRPKERQVCDYTKTASTDGKECEAQILELAERGKIIPAVRLAARLYGYNTTDAKEFVDGLLQ
ncbi:MAG: hypothetical protein ABIF19_19105 [Planctomycetota bacterium]